MEGVTHKLKYRLIESSSEDPDHPLYELLRGTSSNGWMSVRFCTFPQEIIIQFLTPVNLKQINILSNEKKITSMIEFYSYYPSSSTAGDSAQDIYHNFKRVSFQKLGYIRMDTNSRTSYKAREYRKVFINTNCIYLKLVLHKNYLNKYNVFNQVGLISLDFLGIPFNISKTDLYLKESLKDFEFKEEDLDDVSQEKIKILKCQQDEAIRSEDYDEAKRLKMSIDKIKYIGRKIFDMEMQKKVYVNNEDFDNAKILKYEIDRLKVSLRFVDKSLNIVPYSNLSMEINKSSEAEAEEMKENETRDVLENSKSFDKEKEVSFSVNSDQNSVERSALNKSIRSIEKIKEDDFVSYDEKIIPTVLKKLNLNQNTTAHNTSSNTIEELAKEETPPKNELEPLDRSVYLTYEALIKYVGEDCIRKMFSKQTAWKEEGFDIFTHVMSKAIQESKKKSDLNLIINQIMKMINNFLNDRLPQICFRSMETFQKLLNEIKSMKENINYDANITDSILARLKEKLGDVKIKLRKKAIQIYCEILNQNFCDFNNLLTELIEEELKQQVDRRYIRSPKIILGKLLIYDYVFDILDTAIKQKRTDDNQFPLLQIATYVIENISHSKSEIRKLDRIVVKKIYSHFGFRKIEPLLKKVDNRELEKLIRDIPEVAQIIKQNNLKNNPNLSLSTRAIKSEKERERSQGRSSSGGKKSKTRKENKNKENNSSKTLPVQANVTCIHCSRSNITRSLEDHIGTECPMFINCVKCKSNIELRNLTNHLLIDCESKKDFKLCKRCKEAIEVNSYDNHVRGNKCNPAKNINSSNRCPLCHKDIPPHKEGFYEHYVKDTCQKQTRSEKTNIIDKK